MHGAALGTADGLSPLVRVAGPPAGAPPDAPTWVLVHEGTGTLVPYRPLIRELARTAPVSGLVLDDLEAYLSADPEGEGARLAERHAESLLAGGLDRVHLVGYCMGGVLVPDLARRLRDAGAEVTGVSVISGYRVPYAVEDDVLAEYVFARLSRCDTTALGYPADPDGTAELIAAVAARHGDRIPDGGLAQGPGTALSPAGERALTALRTLSESTHEERLRAIGAAMPRDLGVPGDESGADEEGAGAGRAASERLVRGYRAVKHSLAVVGSHRPVPYDGPLTLVRQSGEAEVFPRMHQDMTAYWRRLAPDGFRVVDVPGDHFSCMQPPHVSHVAAALGVRAPEASGR
ncbi:hypothetical protein AN218_27170 [Streptomyces nanshensis]|uniref:Thioesterase domain-containing protein n=1 Tax=Streptomyces nanshensis TaxID=518642 RepID=A0A1E7KWK0_9ACTN|nr:hypothetical protein AN218_27170 [Streptomyces nanshensis]